jgi:hypothetical protein
MPRNEDHETPDTFATRAQLLRPLERRYGALRLPVAGVTVRFQSLSEDEHSDYEMASWTTNEEGDLTRNTEGVRTQRARLIVLCAVDERGARLFGDTDVPQLTAWMDAADSRALYVALRRHCGLFDNPAELEKKSGGCGSGSAMTDGCDSPAGSPSPSAVPTSAG